jgi:hypothetical protein
MFVQWCIKGIRGRLDEEPETSGIDDAEADEMVLGGQGIVCNWWRNAGTISPAERRAKLTAGNLDRHVHDYDQFKDQTPFISLTAGCVERDVAMRLNRIHQAQDVALRFGTDWGARHGYLFFCWVVVGLKRAVSVEGVAEEIRELNTYASWSDYQLEGEVTAKIGVPANQIRAWERWDCDGNGNVNATSTWRHENPRFDAPALVSNIRELL